MSLILDIEVKSVPPDNIRSSLTVTVPSNATLKVGLWDESPNTRLPQTVNVSPTSKSCLTVRAILTKCSPPNAVNSSFNDLPEDSIHISASVAMARVWGIGELENWGVLLFPSDVADTLTMSSAFHALPLSSVLP